MVNHLEINFNSQNKIDDFNELIDKSDHTLLTAVHMPSCEWCAKLSEEWEHLKNGDIKMNDDITLAWVHMKARPSLNKLKDARIDGYPFVIAYRNNQSYIFDGGERTADSLASWANSLGKKESNNQSGGGGSKKRRIKRSVKRTRRKRTRRTKRSGKKTRRKRTYRINKKRSRK